MAVFLNTSKAMNRDQYTDRFHGSLFVAMEVKANDILCRRIILVHSECLFSCAEGQEGDITGLSRHEVLD